MVALALHAMLQRMLMVGNMVHRMGRMRALCLPLWRAETLVMMLCGLRCIDTKRCAERVVGPVQGVQTLCPQTACVLFGNASVCIS